MDRKRCGVKRSWPNLRCYPGICLDELSKTTKTLSNNSRCTGWDLNSGTPEYEAGMLNQSPTTFDLGSFRFVCSGTFVGNSIPLWNVCSVRRKTSNCVIILLHGMHVILFASNWRSESSHSKRNVVAEQWRFVGVGSMSWSSVWFTTYAYHFSRQYCVLLWARSPYRSEPYACFEIFWSNAGFIKLWYAYQ
jgi:hypothetical protein